MHKATVLVVEDDVHLLSGIRDILELENYHVLTAQHGREGLALLEQTGETPPDIIVSDIMMPQMGGFEFLETLRKNDHWVTIPFIFLTAKGEKADVQRGNLLGADLYLTKPFDADDLLVAVQARLDRYKNINRVNTGAISELHRKILTILNHEFRTPLTLVVAYSEMLRDTEPAKMETEEMLLFLKGVNSGADRLRRLIENFILLVELNSGDAMKTFAWRKRPIDDIEGIFKDVRRQVLSTEGVRSCSINIEAYLPQFIADREFLSAAVRELLHNAFKFSSDTSSVELGARRLGADHIEIWVKDEGRGLPEKELEKIWETFYQYNRDYYEHQGAGAGLAIVRGVVQMHHGSCHAESQENVGSRFSLRIPLTPPKAEAAISQNSKNSKEASS